MWWWTIECMWMICLEYWQPRDWALLIQLKTNISTPCFIFSHRIETNLAQILQICSEPTKLRGQTRLCWFHICDDNKCQWALTVVCYPTMQKRKTYENIQLDSQLLNYHWYEQTIFFRWVFAASKLCLRKKLGHDGVPIDGACIKFYNSLGP